MPAITWTATYADGTVLTAAMLEQMKTDITTVVNGSIDSANVSAGSIQTSDLANPNALFCVTVPCTIYHDAFEAVVADPVTNAQFVAARTGITDRIGTTVDFPVGVPATATIVSIHTSCITSTGTNNARLRLNGADVANSTVAFTTATLVRPSTAPTGTVLTTDALLVRVTLSAGAADGVSAPIVYVFFQMAHRVS